MFYVIFYMFYFICSMFYVLCSMFYVLCSMFYVLCSMLYVICYMLCNMTYVSYVLCLKQTLIYTYNTPSLYTYTHTHIHTHTRTHILIHIYHLQLVSMQERAMSWVTPLGLPVIQPYRKVHLHTVSTVLQTITLTLHADHLPVSGKKQRTAFPPNFVHSMDASHMMMTCMRMKQKNLTFAAVHDSYWTHPRYVCMYVCI
jgi:hypothetical protein